MLPFGAWLAFTTAALVLVSGGGSGFAAAAVFCWGAVIMLALDHKQQGRFLALRMSSRNLVRGANPSLTAGR
jgi:hypothetical protein